MREMRRHDLTNKKTKTKTNTVKKTKTMTIAKTPPKNNLRDL